MTGVAMDLKYVLKHPFAFLGKSFLGSKNTPEPSVPGEGPAVRELERRDAGVTKRSRIRANEAVRAAGDAEQLSKRVSLLARVKDAEREGGNHLGAGILDAYSLNRSKLTGDVIKKVEAHLATCPQCRGHVESLKSRASFYSRQRATHGDCG